MERIKSLNGYQKGVLLFCLVLTVVFTVLYPVTISRVGLLYKDSILIPSQEHGSTVYSGRIQGTPSSFTVAQDRSVVFQYGSKTYGPYTAREDPAAIPKEDERKGSMTGVELRCKEEVLFRGGVVRHGDHLFLYNEDGTLEGLDAFAITSGGMMLDGNGNEADPMEPSATTILNIISGPELTHKGDWTSWFYGVFLCLINAVSILFADELFRWNLSFQIRHADRAEPSEWEMATRYISWTLLPILALAIFIVGLQ